MYYKFKARLKNGFSLIELMIVMAILGIVAAIAIPAYSDYVIRAKVSGMLTLIDELKKSLTEYRTVNGNFNSLSFDDQRQIWNDLGMENPIGLIDASQGGTIDGVENKGVLSAIYLASADNRHIAIALCGHRANLGLLDETEQVDLYIGGVYTSSGMRWQCMYEGTIKYIPSNCRTPYDQEVFGQLKEPCKHD